MSKNLRSFLVQLVDALPGDLLRVDEPVDRRFGITAFGAAAEKVGRQPAFFFTDVAGSSLPCVTNLLAARERMALALGCSVDDLSRSLGTLDARSGYPPVQLDGAREAPVKEVVRRGDDVRVSDLPVPVHNELDGRPRRPHVRRRCRCRRRRRSSGDRLTEVKAAEDLPWQA